MTAAELVETIKRKGGVLTLEGESVEYALPADAADLVSQLKQHKRELVRMLHVHGGRVASFPHCPSCLSYALYRHDCGDDYECLTCGLTNIEEAVARRTQ